MHVGPCSRGLVEEARGELAQREGPLRNGWKGMESKGKVGHSR